MNPFQVVAISLLSLVALAGSWRFIRVRSSKVQSALAVLVALAGVVAIAQPELTRLVAELLGIRRGADLVAYCTTLAVILGWFHAQVVARQRDREVTLLTREIALLRAELGPPEGRAAPLPAASTRCEPP